MTFRQLVAGIAVLAWTYGYSQPAGAVVDLFDATSATLTWDGAAGPVAGYYVIVSRNGGEPSVYSWSDDTLESIDAAFGDTIVVQVAAYDAAGVSGPLSPPSEAIRFLQAGSGGDPPPNDGSLPGDTGALPVASPVAFDFTGDGLSDLLVWDVVSGDLSLWAMDGADVTGASALSGLPPPWAIVGHGDYDGNDTSDVLWQNQDTGELSLWLVDAGVVTGGGPLDTSGLDPADDWRVGASGDVDGDGRDEAVLFSRRAGEVEIWSFAGAAISDRITLPGRVGPFSVVAAADCDGDGSAEIIWRDEEAGTLSVWQIVGGMLAASTDLAGSLAGSRLAGAGDVDGDGSEDLVVHHADTGSLEVWFMEGAAVAEVLTFPAGRGADWTALAGGDYDGNAQADVVWVDDVTGAIELWLMVDAAPAAAAVALTLPPDAILANGASGAGGQEVRQRLCDADFDGNGAVGGSDFSLLRRCFGGALDGACAETDMNSDGVVGPPDFDRFRSHFGGEPCTDVF